MPVIYTAKDFQELEKNQLKPTHDDDVFGIIGIGKTVWEGIHESLTMIKWLGLIMLVIIVCKFYKEIMKMLEVVLEGGKNCRKCCEMEESVDHENIKVIIVE